MSEWGNPARGHAGSRKGSQRGELKHLSTRRKGNQHETPLVAASERGRAQTVPGFVLDGVVGPLHHGVRTTASGSSWEGCGVEGETPVRESPRSTQWWFLSTSGHEQSRGNLGGPSSKAKYYLTDR